MVDTFQAEVGRRSCIRSFVEAAAGDDQEQENNAEGGDSLHQLLRRYHWRNLAFEELIS